MSADSASKPATAPDSVLGTPAPPRILVLILTWNGRALTEVCVESVLQQTGPRFDVLVVDNASTDGTAAALQERFGDHIEVLVTDRNLLFAGGMNAGLERALVQGYDWVLLMNNDTRVDPGMLAALLDAATADPRIAAVGPKIYFWDPPDVLWFAGGELPLWRGWSRHRGLRERDRGQHDTARDVDYLTGCAFLVRRSRRCAMWVSSTPAFAMYAEDADWCFRAREQGWRLVYAPGARMWHRVSGECRRDVGVQDSPPHRQPVALPAPPRALVPRVHDPVRDAVRSVARRTPGPARRRRPLRPQERRSQKEKRPQVKPKAAVPRTAGLGCEAQVFSEPGETGFQNFADSSRFQTPPLVG
jgi:GT2 family glycosyltransferase